MSSRRCVSALSVRLLAGFFAQRLISAGLQATRRILQTVRSRYFDSGFCELSVGRSELRCNR